MRRISCFLMRGGTSKAVFFSRSDLPPPGSSRDDILRKIVVGKHGVDPTGMQLDGLGGGISSTSKVAIISKPAVSESNFDLEYEFGQVGLRDGAIDWSGACGNISSAVLKFAQLKGMVQPEKQSARVLQVNNGMILRLSHHLDQLINIPGVYGNSFAVNVEFLDESGGKKVLPTGNPLDVIDGVECTMINYANPTAIVRFKDVEPSLNEQWVENFRNKAAKTMGIQLTDALRVAFIEPSKNYKDSSGCLVDSKDIDFFARITTPSRIFHHALTSTGSSNLAISARIPGTITNAVMLAHVKERAVRIGSSAGIIDLYPKLNKKSGGWTAESIMMKRTTQVLMEGYAYY